VELVSSVDPGLCALSEVRLCLDLVCVERFRVMVMGHVSA